MIQSIIQSIMYGICSIYLVSLILSFNTFNMEPHSNQLLLTNQVASYKNKKMSLPGVNKNFVKYGIYPKYSQQIVNDKHLNFL